MQISKAMNRWCSGRTFRRFNTGVGHGNLDLKETIINIPNASVYRFGDGKYAQPLFQDLTWTVKEGESWAVIGSGGGGEKTVLFNTLLGRYRIAPHPPPPGGLFPFLSCAGLDPYSEVSTVSFGHRQPAGGAFYDYSARYGAVHEEDRLTLRQHMFPQTIPPLRMPYEDPNDTRELELTISDEELTVFDDLVAQMGLGQFLDLPLIALSNGQTRRARILKAVLKRPQLLLLDEPLTGLDIKARPLLLRTLHNLHAKKLPRIILGLRAHDALPDWVDHVAYVRGPTVITGDRDSVLRKIEHGSGGWHGQSKKPEVSKTSNKTQVGEVLIDLKNIKVQYGDRKVLDQLSWQIRQGERWHLVGENGSGKTTLLSLITGDHPQSYTQTRYHTSDPNSSNPSTTRETSSHLQLFSQPRSRLPTTLLRSAIAIMSPELFDAFPRRSSMTVWDVIGTGFDGDFVPKGKRRVGSGLGMKVTSDPDLMRRGGYEGAMEGQDGWEKEENWRIRRVWEVLHALGPEAWKQADTGMQLASTSFSQNSPSDLTLDFSKMSFPSLPLPQQRVVLLMRALVGRAPLIFLDEVWSGMDETMVRVAREYLRGNTPSTSKSSGGGVGPNQAVVVITHWEEEVPWNRDEDSGVFKRFRLGGGKGWVEE
ncbi:P-loop containing nucleoside triphosphate hydrolase protein [Lentinula guzmanii]|uniref:P-loop containing nucleoside triphosphate hydrolase protein n=1 Tax=Lentinula guzmanii TaxID=2804957 RepID=A0AA38JAY0_9AGAR|nr:P-loop containing nucleoside triphosphate hydrolase protein [Lentinula guzmanii]